MNGNRSQSRVAVLILAGLFFGAGCGTGPVQAQDIRGILQSGQSLEDAGEWAKAEQWYEVQTGRNPDQESLAERLFECRLKMKRFEKAVILADEWLGRRPGDRSWRNRKARSLYAGGSRREADVEWGRLLESVPRDVSVYLIVASGMRRDGLLERAEQVLDEGKKKTGSPEVLIPDLADVRIERGRFREAAEVLMEYGAAHPERVGILRDRLDRFPRTGRPPDEVIDAFERAAARGGAPFQVAALILRYALQSGRTQAAYKVAVRMDESAAPGQKGEGLEEFGRAAMDCGEMGWARTAFGEILKRYPDSQRIRDSWMGLMKINRSERRWQEAVSCCDAALAGRHDDSFFQQVMLEKGRLIRDGLFDAHRAKAVFAEIIERFPDAAMRSAWKTETGQCGILTGDLDSARADFREALLLARRERNGDWITPLVWTARTLTYRGDFTAAQDTLSAVTLQALNPDLLRSPLLNDALDMKMRLSASAACCPENLRMLAAAEWMARRRLYREAIAVLDSIPAEGSALFSEALLRKAALYHELGRDDECRAEIRRFLARFPGHESSDRALLLLGRSEERSGSLDRALEAYDRILRTRPRSAAAGEARERIRLSRKEEK
jgi:tetratricopeptide (TPR) repeat protein